MTDGKLSAVADPLLRFNRGERFCIPARKFHTTPPRPPPHGFPSRTDLLDLGWMMPVVLHTIRKKGWLDISLNDPAAVTQEMPSLAEGLPGALPGGIVLL